MSTVKRKYERWYFFYYTIWEIIREPLKYVDEKWEITHYYFFYDCQLMGIRNEIKGKWDVLMKYFWNEETFYELVWIFKDKLGQID